MGYVRCTAHRANLDGKENACPRCHKHTRLLMEKFRSQVLWKEYGIIDDILVGPLMVFKPLPLIQLYISHLQLPFLEQIYIN